ncbi:proteasome assembly chaperone 4 [Plakobranchus ocellatus]|uniref:Proteasome assembly chaperone 4 n=1 Tax=Plakobranchus ocellatus TaxID=259542 RepID=A0AAV4BNY3_9GAST|nr:proteasome assembly chaperone 4 [Plakobranchus ocellatus]
MAASTETKIKILDFSENLLDKTVHFKLMTLDSSFFVWIGTNLQLTNMAVSMPPIFDNTPSTSTILGSKCEETSASLALKLAKKFKQQVFVSCTVPFDPQLSLLIEKRLMEELKKYIGS